MAIENGYVSLDDVKRRLDIQGDEENVTLEQIVEAASRQIDGWCDRVFYTTTETRLATAETPYLLALDRDLITLTALATDDGTRTFETVWATTDYDIEPNNPPYSALRTAYYGDYVFPLGRHRVRVTGTWGYGTTVPHAIREACLLLVGRLYKRKDAPFGITGNADHGQLLTLPGMDPDIKQLIADYRRPALLV